MTNCWRDSKSEICVDFRNSTSEAYFWNEFKEEEYQKPGLVLESGCLEKDKWFSGVIKSGSDYLLKL